jgi:hypothetical protein
MNEKLAKAVRRYVTPGRDETGVSRGRLVRELTTYEARKTGSVKGTMPVIIEGPPGIKWAKVFVDNVVDKYTFTVEETCPRGMIHKFKRMADGNVHLARRLVRRDGRNDGDLS